MNVNNVKIWVDHYKQSWSREVRQRDLSIIRKDELKLNSKFSSGEG